MIQQIYILLIVPKFSHRYNQHLARDLFYWPPRLPDSSPLILLMMKTRSSTFPKLKLDLLRERHTPRAPPRGSKFYAKFSRKFSPNFQKFP